MFLFLLFAQIFSSANDNVPNYDWYFGFGMNPGYHGSQWDDSKLANLYLGNPEINQTGIGSNALRGKLHEVFIDTWGVGIRYTAYENYGALGALQNSVFLEDPSDDHLDTTEYCSGHSSKLWENMYEPIFHDNGTVNENNYMANYVFKVVNGYHSRNVRFWEIINEPDYTSSSHGWESSSQPESWWNVNPDPCDLPNLYAPIQRYVRALRIAYEVVKYVDPTNFVCVGGIGYDSFLDAVLRNSDNPADGSIVNQDYPLKGGAYFDCLSFHKYPMYSLSESSANRHSDGAVDAFFEAKDTHQELLKSYGYNGNQYPKKRSICTETNVPSAQIGSYIGSPMAQVNYIMKSILRAPHEELDQIDFFCLSTSNTGTSSYNYMGFYDELSSYTPYNQVILESGIAGRTVGHFVTSQRYDAERTAKLNTPENVEGYAYFHSEEEKEEENNSYYVHALWARTETDLSEDAHATYSFPVKDFTFSKMTIFEWNYTETLTSQIMEIDTYPIEIQLTSSPVFVVFDGDSQMDQSLKMKASFFLVIILCFVLF